MIVLIIVYFGFTDLFSSDLLVFFLLCFLFSNFIHPMLLVGGEIMILITFFQIELPVQQNVDNVIRKNTLYDESQYPLALH